MKNLCWGRPKRPLHSVCLEILIETKEISTLSYMKYSPRRMDYKSHMCTIFSKADYISEACSPKENWLLLVDHGKTALNRRDICIVTTLTGSDHRHASEVIYIVNLAKASYCQRSSTKKTCLHAMFSKKYGSLGHAQAAPFSTPWERNNFTDSERPIFVSTTWKSLRLEVSGQTLKNEIRDWAASEFVCDREKKEDVS